ncbi:FMN-dependent NADH-azoreductase [Methylocaldum marinum]|uniref:FMN dependent NADH:quinone oxidoreductase n=1 Tax=Methylocaldum marinum TaxID=1432792 RepID=A0A250KMW8_9GAMM|nr:NAD(P)H-dependent oxidoreductase [Methylocaldum marinum]BBA33043.1 FMN-dependent NADH-azoreductase [Methylocaldum marinum]
MKTLLQLNTSLFSEQGQSTRLAQRFVEIWRTLNSENSVIVRDLAKDPAPHLTAERFQAFLAPAEERSTEQQAVVAYSDGLIDELRRADVIVLGLPMYNFGVPSTLKAYFDHVARVDVTFRYAENGPVGLLADKPVYVLATRGGAYRGTSKDTQTLYVQDFFNFLGISDIRFVYAEGLNLGPERQHASLAEAEAQIGRLAA